MSLRMPPHDSEIRGLFDVRDLAMWSQREARSKAGSFVDTLKQARSWLDRNDDIAFLHQFVYRANGDLWLVRITRIAWSKVWDFGQ
jgi:hypothetical protein